MTLADRVGNSLRSRLLFSLTALLLFGLAITIVYLREASEKNWRGVIDRSLQAQALALANAYRPDLIKPLAELPAEWREAYDRSDSGFDFTIYDRFMRPIESSASLKGKQLPLQGLPRADQRIGEVSLAGPDNIPVVAVRLDDGGVAIVARSGIRGEALVESMYAEDLETVLVFMLFGVGAIIMITVVTILSLRPIIAASREAAMIGPHSVHRRINPRGVPVEVLPLVDAFNGALDRLAEAQTVQRRLTADAAHELRTPLSVLSLRLQRARMGEALNWPEIITDLARMSRLIEQLLDLARKEASASSPEGRESVKLSRLVREAAAQVLPLAEQFGRAIEVEIAAPIIIENARWDDLLDMVRNLIENAIIHGKGTVRVGLTEAANRNSRLTVSDEGRTPIDADSFFDRFRRGDEERPGSGLGLAIVRQVATVHGGAVRFAESATTCIEVLLPGVIAAEARVQAG